MLVRDISPDSTDFQQLVMAALRLSVIPNRFDADSVEASPLALNPSLADYVIAIDDSGGIEPLLSSDGNYHVSKQTIFLLGAYGIPLSTYLDFNFDWNELRTQIKLDLSATCLPPIHMRLMYGKTLPEKHGVLLNPYRHADFAEQIMPWLNYAKALMFYYSTGRGPIVEQQYVGPRYAFYSEFCKIMTRTKLWKDLRYLKKHYKAGYRFAVSRLSSPIPRTLGRLLGLINEHLRLEGKTAIIIYDKFNVSQGVTDATVDEVINRLGFSHIVATYKVDSSDNVPLVQATDVYAYTMHRMNLGIRGDISTDSNLVPFHLESHPMAFEANKRWDNHLFENDWHKQMLLQYAILREGAALAKNGKTLYPLLVTVDEFAERLEANKGKKRPRVSMFIDSDLSKNY